MNQLSFADLLAPKEGKPPSVWEKMATGLKANRMGANDRVEFLEEQLGRLRLSDSTPRATLAPDRVQQFRNSRGSI